MSEQESERIAREAETDPDVEGHKKHRSGEAAPDEDEAGMRGESDEPDVEAHKKH